MIVFSVLLLIMTFGIPFGFADCYRPSRHEISPSSALLWSCLLFSTAAYFAQTSKIAPDLLSLIEGSNGRSRLWSSTIAVPGLLEITRAPDSRRHNHPAIFVDSRSRGHAARAPWFRCSLWIRRCAYISPDRQVAGTLDLSAAASGADIAYQAGYTGKGVGVAIVDSGIFNHPDLASRIVYRQSFVAATNLDDYGHGTHVAGIVASSGASSTGPQYTRTFRGIAPGANLIDLRVLDAQRDVERQHRDRRDRSRHQPEDEVQHPGDEPVDRPADL